MREQHDTPKDLDTFWIPEYYKAELDARIAKLNKKATKLNCPPLEYHILGSKSVAAKGYEEEAEILGEDKVPHVKMIEVQLTGKGPKIEGWKFLGTLDHYSLPGSVIVKTVPGEKIPEQFYTTDAMCDHCGKIRRRNETFILQEESTGKFKRVGRQCVRDFIGHDPNVIIRYMHSLMNFSEQFSNEEKYGYGSLGQEQYVFDHIDVLAKTAAVIDKHGWIPRSAVDEYHNATADDVLSIYFHPKPASTAYADWKQWCRELDLDNPKWIDEAEKAREWLKQQPADGEYWHNLHTIDQADAVPANMFGYWCSVMSGYQRATEKLRLAEHEKKSNEHVGNVKERRDFIVVLKKKRSFDSRFGTVRLHEFLDDEGHTLTWWANVDPKMELDGKYHIKGTVKAHDEYNGWAQTVLTRVKVVEHL